MLLRAAQGGGEVEENLGQAKRELFSCPARALSPLSSTHPPDKMFAATAPTALTQRSVRANVRSARRTVVCRAGPQETPAAVKTLAAAGVIAAVVASPAYAVVSFGTVVTI